jgi:iron complex transport system substrate-binding protein
MLHKVLHTAGLSVLLAACLFACSPTPVAPAPAGEATEAPVAEPAVSEPTQEVPETPALPKTTYSDGLGRIVTFDGAPERIVSLAPSNTEILFAVGAGSQVVGRDEFSDYPEGASSLTSVGGPYSEFDTETIVALVPDLVLAGGINTPEQVHMLEGLGLRVFYLANPMDFDGLFDNLVLVGEMTGHTTEAESLVAELETRVEAVELKVDPDNRPSVYYEVDATDLNAPWTTGAGTFQDVLITTAGGVNVFADLEGWVQLSLEEIVRRDPDVMLFGSGPYVPTTVDSVSQRPGWAGIEAVSTGRVYGVDTNWVDRPGPRLVDALEAVAAVLMPVAVP